MPCIINTPIIKAWKIMSNINYCAQHPDTPWLTQYTKSCKPLKILNQNDIL